MKPVFLPGRHKFGAKKSVREGKVFASRLEARYWDRLMMRLEAGEILSVELQPKFELQPPFVRNGKTIRAISYIADFRVEYPDGRVEIIDCKGYRTYEYLLKKKLFQYRYPDLEIVEVTS